MKTTFDLPAGLVKELKLRAVKDGLKLKDVAAAALRAGLALERGKKKREVAAPVVKDKLTGLPVIQCRHKAAPGQELTSERLAEILADQEAEWARDSR